MKGPNRHGRWLVLLILAAGLTLAIVGRFYYTAARPASLHARPGENRTIIAEFSPAAAVIIRNGMKATVSLSGTAATGRVAGRDLMQEHTFVVILDPAAPAPAPDTTVRVVIDTTVPPQLPKN